MEIIANGIKVLGSFKLATGNCRTTTTRQVRKDRIEHSNDSYDIHYVEHISMSSIGILIIKKYDGKIELLKC